MDAQQARELALALDGAIEKDHHGKPSFRLTDKGRIFATLWADDELNVMLDEPGIRTAVEAHPDICTEVWWGKRLSAVKVALPDADPDLVAELLEDAWEGKGGARPRDDNPPPTRRRDR